MICCLLSEKRPVFFKGAVSYFTHMLLRITNLKFGVGPTFSSLESKMPPSTEGEHGGKRDNSGQKKDPR